MERQIISSLEECLQFYVNHTVEGIHCNATWDQITCWPPTIAGEQAKQLCPRRKGVDATKYAYKYCGEDGWWASKSPNDSKTLKGWTNYSECYTKETRHLFDLLYGDSPQNVQMKFQVAQSSRNLEMIGLLVSFFCLIASLFIFCHFRRLRNPRTRIHQQLFIAILIQVLIRLILYTDQYLTRDVGYKNGIENTSILCEAFYILLEYARTAMFMWMFVEGMYLNNVLVIEVFVWKTKHGVLMFIGWGIPVFMTSAWASISAIYFSETQCWWGYSFAPYFWILEGPRLTVIAANLIFLLNIIRILVTKLKENNTTEAQQVRGYSKLFLVESQLNAVLEGNILNGLREYVTAGQIEEKFNNSVSSIGSKAVRAAIILLPLLGITNILGMVHAPIDRNVWEFALWTYVTTFLTSFQGFFISVIYCFLNGEVRAAFTSSWRSRKLQQSIGLERRHSHRSTCGKIGLITID